MEALYLLLLLLSHWITSSAATTISSVFKAPGKSSTTFAVGDKETAILATKSPSGRNFNFTLSAKGKLIKSGTCDNCYPESVWVPFFMITNKRGNSKYVNPFDIPEDVGPLDEIDLSVESKEEMEWQIFTLPLEKDDSTRTYLENYVIFDLPEDEEVWLACRSKNGNVIRIPLQLNASNQANLYNSNINVKRDWLIIRIYEDKIDLGDSSSDFEGPVRKGRSLRLGKPQTSPPEYQVFSVPIRPKDIITPIIISVVVVVLLLLLAASYFCYRFFLKKKKNNNNKPRSEGNATVTREWTSTAGFSRRGVHPSLNRQDSPHVSENSLYSVPTDAHAGFDRIPSSRDSENSLYAVPTFVQPGLTRQNSSHDSENSLYDVPEVAHPGLAR